MSKSQPNTHGVRYVNYGGASGQGAADLFGLSNMVIVPPHNLGRLISSGNIGLRDDETIPSDLHEEVEQVFQNMTKGLKAAGLGPNPWNNVIKLTVYVIHENRDQIFEVSNAASKRYFGETKPAMAAVVVPAIMHPDARVELEVEAFVPLGSKL